SITTKSDLIVRDLALLSEISRRNVLSVNMTVTTLNRRLARLMEPRAPRPDLRLAAVRKLRAAGLAAGVFAMPVLPGITDRESDLDALMAGAKGADAQWFSSGVLFLMSTSAKHFLPFVEKTFPKLARQYHDWFGGGGRVPEIYYKGLERVVSELRRKYGLASRPVAPACDRAQPQLSLALEPACPATARRRDVVADAPAC
ncbi:MAG: radical SAM protein, partial [Bryobacteraceae bacterium]